MTLLYSSPRDVLITGPRIMNLLPFFAAPLPQNWLIELKQGSYPALQPFFRKFSWYKSRASCFFLAASPPKPIKISVGPRSPPHSYPLDCNRVRWSDFFSEPRWNLHPGFTSPRTFTCEFLLNFLRQEETADYGDGVSIPPFPESLEGGLFSCCEASSSACLTPSSPPLFANVSQAETTDFFYLNLVYSPTNGSNNPKPPFPPNLLVNVGPFPKTPRFFPGRYRSLCDNLSTITCEDSPPPA